MTNESPQVAMQLAEKALHGDEKAEGALRELSDPGSGFTEETTTMRFSQALAWKAEPEWKPESSEEDAEMACGSREPENCAD